MLNSEHKDSKVVFVEPIFKTQMPDANLDDFYFDIDCCQWAMFADMHTL